MMRWDGWIESYLILTKNLLSEQPTESPRVGGSRAYRHGFNEAVHRSNSCTSCRSDKGTVHFGRFYC